MKALLINGAGSSIIEVDGINGIRGYFAGQGDFIGKTLPSDGEICVRQWKSVKRARQGIEILSAYKQINSEVRGPARGASADTGIGRFMKEQMTKDTQRALKMHPGFAVTKSLDMVRDYDGWKVSITAPCVIRLGEKGYIIEGG